MAERQSRWRMIMRSRRTAYALSALWLIYSAIAVFLLVTADTTQLRWIAGIQLVCGLAAAGCYLALARQVGSDSARSQ